MLKAIKYGATWCHQCKQQDKELERNDLLVPVSCVDVDDISVDETTALDIMSIPVVILYDEDTEVQRWVGLTQSSVINEFIQNYQNNGTSKSELPDSSAN